MVHENIIISLHVQTCTCTCTSHGVAIKNVVHTVHVQWNLSINDLRNKDTFLIRTLHVVPRVSIIERFHCICTRTCTVVQLHCCISMYMYVHANVHVPYKYMYFTFCSLVISLLRVGGIHYTCMLDIIVTCI